MKSKSEQSSHVLVLKIFLGSILLFMPPFILWKSIVDSREKIFLEKRAETEKKLTRNIKNYEQISNPFFSIYRDLLINSRLLASNENELRRIRNNGRLPEVAGQTYTFSASDLINQ
ncbi:MAG: hypothetical protein Kow0029_23760 [Candidatus Rifleibacteriota bacterium]